MAKFFEKVTESTKNKVKIPSGKPIKAEISKPAFAPKAPVFVDKGDKGRIAKKKPF